MDNDLLISFYDASNRYNHIVFDNRTQRFERAGLRHAIATFFGAPDATAKNRATLDAIKSFLEDEQMEEFGHCNPDKLKGYFSGIKESKVIESSTINRIINKFRDDMSILHVEEEAEKIVRGYLDEEENFTVFESPKLKGCFTREMVGRIARFVVDDALRKNPVSNSQSFGLFRYEATHSLDSIMWRLSSFIEYNPAEGHEIAKLFDMLKKYDAEKGDGSKCLDRFIEALSNILDSGDELGCDEIALTFFLGILLYGNGLELMKTDQFSGAEIAAAFNAVSKHPSFRMSDQLSTALELKLKAGEMQMEALEGLVRVIPSVREEDMEDFLSIAFETLKRNEQMLSSADDVEDCASRINDTFQFLRSQSGCHPEALKDGVQLMKDLKTAVDAETMASLLNMAKKVTDGILHPENSVCDSIDRNLSSICFAGNTIASEIDKDEKNWIVTKFVLSAAAKVSYPQTTDRIGENAAQQYTCGTRILSSARDLQALYTRAGGPLCAKYARALEFLADRYWMSDLYDQYNADEPNVRNVSDALLEKYEMQKRTKAKSDRYKIKITDYREFDGLQESRKKELAAFIDEIVSRARILPSDKTRVKQLVLQDIAHHCQASKGRLPDDKEIRQTAQRYCRLAQWGGALLDRLANEVPVSFRKAVVLALAGYDFSSDRKLFDMLTKNQKVLKSIKEYVDECEKGAVRTGMPEGSSVQASYIHTILTGQSAPHEKFDSNRNIHLSAFYSHSALP